MGSQDGHLRLPELPFLPAAPVAPGPWVAIDLRLPMPVMMAAQPPVLVSQLPHRRLAFPRRGKARGRIPVLDCAIQRRPVGVGAACESSCVAHFSSPPRIKRQCIQAHPSDQHQRNAFPSLSPALGIL